ncbi:MAG: hypothetical protein WCW29_02945 [Candidatus Paceibacterota bacterium]
MMSSCEKSYNHIEKNMEIEKVLNPLVEASYPDGEVITRENCMIIISFDHDHCNNVNVEFYFYDWRTRDLILWKDVESTYWYINSEPGGIFKKRETSSIKTALQEVG